MMQIRNQGRAASSPSLSLSGSANESGRAAKEDREGRRRLSPPRQFHADSPRGPLSLIIAAFQMNQINSGSPVYGPE